MAKKRRTESAGACVRCDATLGKSGMAAHLVEHFTADPGAGDDRGRRHLLILVEAFEPYWLYLAAPAAATLEQLDAVLRAVWLECCGHLSAFTIDRQRYAVAPMPPDEGFHERSMAASLGEALPERRRFVHEYDYGTTTTLALKVVGEWMAPAKGARPAKPALVARNAPPDRRCEQCEAPATQVCPYCLDTDGDGWRCAKCAAQHECEVDVLAPVVNSPRVGVCGYTGPVARGGWGPA